MRFVFAAVVALGLLDACSSDSSTSTGPGNAADSGSGGDSSSGSGGRASGGAAGGRSDGGSAGSGAAGASTGGVSPGSGGSGGGSGGSDVVDAGSGGTTGDASDGSDASAGGATSAGGTTSDGGATSDGGNAGASSGGSGGAADGGAPGAGGAPNPVTIDIVDAQTAFQDYGKLRVAFSQAVDASTVTIGLSPVKPAALGVTAVTAVNATTVDATLAYYHLPRDYQITVSGKLQDGTPFTASGTIPGQGNGSRIAFLTKQTGTANFKSWPNAPSSASTGLEAADGICQAEALAAGYHGTFAAFLSTKNADDAGCRLFGLHGTVAAKCGQASMPVDHAPWLAMNGLPIALGATAVVADGWDLPIPFSADGTTPGNSLVWTGSNPGAVGSGSDCTAWGATTGFTSMDIFLDSYIMSYDGGSSCSDNRNLACFQIGGTFFGPNTLHQVQGRRLFVSKGQLTGNMTHASLTGVAAADALCQEEASAAGYANSSAFHAYLGSATADAMCHVIGKTGTVGTKCGLSQFPTDVSWRRADDYPVGTVAELLANQLTAPILFAADGSRQAAVRPWTGTQGGGSTQQNCSDWTSATGSGYVGSPRPTSSGWSFYSTGSCSAPAPVYCFEQ
ncbi:MAG TPA: hypothetical protein VHE30_20580 [Polyangiaceae bacterium]|nr:hypothetical protein [Polyangiaceae bacterium]